MQPRRGPRGRLGIVVVVMTLACWSPMSVGGSDGVVSSRRRARFSPPPSLPKTSARKSPNLVVDVAVDLARGGAKRRFPPRGSEDRPHLPWHRPHSDTRPEAMLRQEPRAREAEEFEGYDERRNSGGQRAASGDDRASAEASEEEDQDDDDRTSDHDDEEARLQRERETLFFFDARRSEDWREMAWFARSAALTYYSFATIVAAHERAYFEREADAVRRHADGLGVEAVWVNNRAESARLVVREVPHAGMRYFARIEGHVTHVAVKGSDNARNFRDDVDYAKVVDESCLGARLHRGFKRVADAIWRDGKTLFKGAEAAEQTFELCGHSLGGGAATILGMRLSAAGKKVSKVLTFGAPKVTNARGANLFAPRLPLLRVLTADDPVPTLPSMDLASQVFGFYRHFGHRVVLYDDDDDDDDLLDDFDDVDDVQDDDDVVGGEESSNKFLLGDPGGSRRPRTATIWLSPSDATGLARRRDVSDWSAKFASRPDPRWVGAAFKRRHHGGYVQFVRENNLLELLQTQRLAIAAKVKDFALWHLDESFLFHAHHVSPVAHTMDAYETAVQARCVYRVDARRSMASSSHKGRVSHHRHHHHHHHFDGNNDPNRKGGSSSSFHNNPASTATHAAGAQKPPHGAPQQTTKRRLATLVRRRGPYAACVALATHRLWKWRRLVAILQPKYLIMSLLFVGWTGAGGARVREDDSSDDSGSSSGDGSRRDRAGSSRKPRHNPANRGFAPDDDDEFDDDEFDDDGAADERGNDDDDGDDAWWSSSPPPRSADDRYRAEESRDEGRGQGGEPHRRRLIRVYRDRRPDQVDHVLSVARKRDRRPRLDDFDDDCDDDDSFGGSGGGLAPRPSSRRHQGVAASPEQNARGAAATGLDQPPAGPGPGQNSPPPEPEALHQHRQHGWWRNIV